MSILLLTLKSAEGGNVSATIMILLVLKNTNGVKVQVMRQDRTVRFPKRRSDL